MVIDEIIGSFIYTNVCIVVYLKNNDDLIFRFNRPTVYKVGDYNGNNWLILDVKILYENKFISYKKYYEIMKEKEDKRYKTSVKNRKIKKVLEMVDNILW